MCIKKTISLLKIVSKSNRFVFIISLNINWRIYLEFFNDNISTNDFDVFSRTTLNKLIRKVVMGENFVLNKTCSQKQNKTMT